MSAERPVDWKNASCAPDPCPICGSLVKQPLYPATYNGSIGEAATYFLANELRRRTGRSYAAGTAGSFLRAPAFRT
jgi:hypothetical protein